MPSRIQRSRAKGWRMPEGATYVGRPTRFGNPYRIGLAPCGCRSIGECTHNTLRVWDAATAVEGYRVWIEAWPPGRRAWLIETLRGHDLVCWCPLVDAEGNPYPCHADLLIEIANG